MRKVFLLLLMLLILSAASVVSGVAIPTGFSSYQYQVEEVAANLFNDNTLLVVSGKIKNMSGLPIRGYVVVYLKNNDDEVVHAFEGDVNGNAPFNHGAKGAFELSANIEGLKANNVSVEFVPNKSL